MEKKRFTIAFLLSGLVLLLSCTNNSKSNKELKDENEMLMREIESLQEQIKNIEYMPILLPKESSVKFGDNYEVAFFTGTFNSTMPPNIVIKSINGDTVSEVLKYDDDLRCSIFSYKPTQRGRFNLNAEMEVYTIFDTLIFPVRWSFDAF